MYIATVNLTADATGFVANFDLQSKVLSRRRHLMHSQIDRRSMYRLVISDI